MTVWNEAAVGKCDWGSTAIQGVGFSTNAIHLRIQLRLRDTQSYFASQGRNCCPCLLHFLLLIIAADITCCCFLHPESPVVLLSSNSRALEASVPIEVTILPSIGRWYVTRSLTCGCLLLNPFRTATVLQGPEEEHSPFEISAPLSEASFHFVFYWITGYLLCLPFLKKQSK